MVNGRSFRLEPDPRGHLISSRDQHAFAGPNATKYRWKVIPFGPVNGPVIFIIFIYDMNTSWQELAVKRGLKVGEEVGTKIIIDDIFSWGDSYKISFLHLDCQLYTCLLQRLSLNLDKCISSRIRSNSSVVMFALMETILLNPKHELLMHWPQPETVRDLASIGCFGQFMPFVFLFMN